MKLTQTEAGVILTECDNFDPFVSCECGQCFRFERGDGFMSLFACGRELKFAEHGGGYIFYGIDKSTFVRDFVPYFDLERDYGAIAEEFSAYPQITRAYGSGAGIRIFRQDPWETVVSFIISQNNNIPRIKKIISSLCALLGERDGDIYKIPTPQAIYNAGVEGLAPIKAGFRAKYLVDAAEKVLSREVDLGRIANEPYELAFEELKTIKGVGDKVASCILLFGFARYEAFPVDVWVRRILNKYFEPDFDPKTLGQYAGIAQQWLFNFERNGENGEKED